LINDPEYKPGIRKNHVKIQGVKFYSDGSPQGKTAFFSKPYLTEVPGCDSDCRGIPLVTQEQFNEAVKTAFTGNIQFYAHANGDSAIGMFIHAVENANKELNTSSLERRTVSIHSQFVRDDQLTRYAELGFVPSFFSNHAFFWGDTHVSNLGKDRAYFLSPLKTSLDKGIIYTNHTDYGVTPIDQLFLLWTSVVRQSRSGEIIGSGERITPMEGLRALTINGAYQYFEEEIKGSIEAGKLADMVILSDNPVTINPDEIKDIVVLETIKEGETIYKKL
jgi:predicted amidohydrolase YtcJ